MFSVSGPVNHHDEQRKKIISVFTVVSIREAREEQQRGKSCAEQDPTLLVIYRDFCQSGSILYF
jgi:hypothetical protein